MPLDKYRITNWFPLGDRQGKHRSIRFDVSLLDELGPAWDLSGFLINGEGRIMAPTAYAARSTKQLKLILGRDDIMAQLEDAWQTHPLLREELSNLYGFMPTEREEKKTVEFGGDDDGI